MSARPWQVWSNRAGMPKRIVRTYGTREAAITAAARWNSTAERAGLNQSYAVRKRS